MTVYDYVIKHGFVSSNWQILQIHSLVPFEFSELFNGKTWDLLKNKKLISHKVVSYYRSLEFSKYILVIGD